MTRQQVALLLAVVATAVLADDRPRGYSASRPSSDEGSFEEPKYDFNWQVDDEGNNFGQQEQRDNDNTQGSYSVDLPDGRRQTVTYYVNGDSGYVAEVSYSGEAQYSEESQEYKPRRPYDN